MPNFDYYYRRWAPEVRMSGLERLASGCAGKSVLDLGSAEGLIARCFLQGGAAVLHGVDIVSDRVIAAREVCGDFGNASFWQADLSDWPTFRARHAGHLLPWYDIVLYLGLHHHLPAASRGSTLAGAAAMSGDVFALRTPDACYEEGQAAERLQKRGFRLSLEHRSQTAQELGTLRIFSRSEGGASKRD
jgi:hypothetical protein